MVKATMAALQQLRSNEEIKAVRFGDKAAAEA
jgi:small subunit ribosomal protein S5